MDFDVIFFPMQNTSMHRNFQNHQIFGSILKKNCKNYKLNFHLKINLHRYNFFYFIQNLKKVYSDRSEQDNSDETIRIRSFPFSRKFDEKTAENQRNCYVAEKRKFFIISKIQIPNFNNTNINTEQSLYQNFTSLSFTVSEKLTVKLHHG